MEAAEVAARHVDRLDRAVGEVLEDTRNHPVVAGAQLPLSLVAPALAQRWADTLSVADVEIGAELLGDGSLVVTPGPLEQLLDEVLAAVLAHRGRAVRLALDGEERHVRATVQVLASSVHDPTPEAERALLRARAVAETLGGRIAGSLVAEDGLSVVLPRR